MDVQLTMDALKEELRKAWNRERACVEEVDDVNTGEKRKRSPTHPTEESVTNPTKKIKFVPVSPKVDLLPNFKCDSCGKVYSYLKSLKRHIKDNHKDKEVPQERTEVKDKVTCRMCNKKQSRDLITRHLKDVHKMTNVTGGKSVFRGFLTVNGSMWLPLWLEKGVKDPPSEMVLEVIKDKVSVLGVEDITEDVKNSEREESLKRFKKVQIGSKQDGQSGEQADNVADKEDTVGGSVEVRTFFDVQNSV